MLLQLSIQNFAIVRTLDIDWQQGMTTITGETGAGKSIAIDALGLCLGERATTNVVRPNTEKAELVATFETKNNTQAQRWLQNHDLILQDESECLLKRVISAQGRSKAYINGSQVPLIQLKELGQLLINIHGQHDHQLIVKASEQRNILDNYANHHHLLDAVKHYAKEHKVLCKEYQQLLENKKSHEARLQLLQYQVAELDEFSIQQGEFETLENDFKRYSNAQDLLSETLKSLDLLSQNSQFNVLDSLRLSHENLASLSKVDPQLNNIVNLLNDAVIQIDEANADLSQYYEQLDLDPQTYAAIESRYSQAIQLAKKHLITPEKLYEHHIKLKSELLAISHDESRIDIIIDEIENAKLVYYQAAKSLTGSRKSAAENLSQSISKSMQELNMPHGQFSVLVKEKHSDDLSLSGNDEVGFLVSINPGQALEEMHKVASGGELSRISLAMQVILADKVVTPTLIFDEVDVGISGSTAAMVGNKLQQLAKNTQVICVTHLPQVASKGHQQLYVAKFTDGEHTETKVTELSEQSRVREIARLLAGDKISEHSLANAQELLAG